MSRSLKKGPFADASLLKKVDALNAANDKSVDRKSVVSGKSVDLGGRRIIEEMILFPPLRQEASDSTARAIPR